MEYYLILDTETTNSMVDDKVDASNSLFYDLGFAVIDECGNIYYAESFVNKDIFYNEELMNSAYYKDKIPQYVEDLANGTRTLATTYEIKKAIFETMAKYNITSIVAHNARFDYACMNATTRYLTKSKYRYYLPFGTMVIDTLKMARNIFGKDADYIQYCKDNEYMTKRNQPRLTAEILYRYLTNKNDFVESHTGFEDVLIEKEIFAECMRRNKDVEKFLWENT